MKFVLGLLTFVLVFTVGQHLSTSTQDPRAYVHLISQEDGNCSGVVIKPHQVLTAAHCTAMDHPIFDHGKEMTLVRRDEGRDLALYWSEDAQCPCAPIADSNPTQGSEITVIGFPVGSMIDYVKWRTLGNVQEFRDVSIWGDKDKPKATFMFHSASAYPGMSGGGVFQRTLFGYRLVGITTAFVGIPSGYGSFPAFDVSISSSAKSINEFLNPPRNFIGVLVD